MYRKIFEVLRLLNDEPFRFINPDTLNTDSGYTGRVTGYLKSTTDILRETLGFEPEVLGSGHYSDVYGLNDKVVLKVSRREDRAYQDYADFCARNQGNPYLPRIHYAARSGFLRFYFMERLTPLCDSDDEYSFSLPEEYEWLFSHKSLGRLVSSGLVDMRHVCPHAYQLLNWLAETPHSTDIHPKNVALRGEQLVVTDPCC